MTEIARDWMRTNALYFTQSPGAYADLSSKGSRTHVRGFGVKKTGEAGGMVGGYKAQKLKKWGFVYPILVASGALKRSITQFGDTNSLFELLDKSNLILGTKVQSSGGVDYPKLLDEGTKFMPARPFLTVPSLSIKRWVGILEAYVSSAMGNPGGPGGDPGKAAAAAKQAASGGPIQPDFGRGAPSKAPAATAREKMAAPATASKVGAAGGKSSEGSASASAKKKKKKLK